MLNVDGDATTTCPSESTHESQIMIACHTVFLTLAPIVVWLSVAGCDDQRLLAQCAVHLLNVSNQVRRTVYLTTSPQVTRNFRTELLLSMHLSHQPTLLLDRFDVALFNPNRYVLPHAYVVAARGVPDLTDHLDTINVTHASWRPGVHFVVVLETLADVSQSALEPVYRRFWTNHMFKSVLVAPSVTVGGAVDAFAWYPFRNRCGEYHAPKSVDACAVAAAADGAPDLFGDRIPDKFRNCTVKIAAFNWPPMTVLSPDRSMSHGMDVGVVELMSRFGNVRLEVVEVAGDQRWGIKSPNGTWNGGFGMLSRHQADVLIGGGIMTAERSEMFDSVPPRQVIRFPIYTPLPRRLPYWQNMLNVFSGHFWLTVFAVFLLTSALLWLSGVHLASERRAFADGGHCLVVSWSVLCSVSAGRQPTSVSSKMVFLSWTVYVLHISAVYTSMQLIYLYKPKYERAMRTIDDVRASGLTVCCVPTFIPIAHAMAPENFNLTNYIPCTDMVTSSNRLLRHKDIIILDPEDHFETLISGSAKKVNKVEEVVIVYNIGVYMRKGSPYKLVLSRAQIAAYETGLHSKWRHDASPSRPPKKEKHVKVKMLNMDELQGAFIILICGLCGSAVVFLFERFCADPVIK